MKAGNQVTCSEFRFFQRSSLWISRHVLKQASIWFTASHVRPGNKTSDPSQILERLAYSCSQGDILNVQDTQILKYRERSIATPHSFMTFTSPCFLLDFVISVTRTNIASCTLNHPQHFLPCTQWALNANKTSWLSEGSIHITVTEHP